VSEVDSDPRTGEQTLEGRGSAALLEAPAAAEQRVTPLELFFDLVFVFAITQVTGYVYSDPTWTRFVEGLAILAVLWFGWSCYAWLGNNANTDDGLVRVILLSAIAAMVITSLAVPRAFGADGLLFGIAYFVVRLLHIACYTALARDLHDATLGRAVARLASTMLPAAAVLVAAGALAGTPRAICWAVALAIDYSGIVLRGVEGWRVEPGHFAERHSAVIIIALGESVVALGVGAHSGLSLSGSVIAGALLGITAISALWWVYFDMVSIVGERRFRSAPPRAQVLIARDSYTLLHLFMVGGIVVFAIGVKEALAHHDAHLEAVPAVALCGGLALYLLALSGFKRRNLGTFNRPRLLCAALLLALIPAAATAVPALAALALVTTILCGLIGYEFWRYAEFRARVRRPVKPSRPLRGSFSSRER
jgi:low temperature requirement protein LtrA